MENAPLPVSKSFKTVLFGGVALAGVLALASAAYLQNSASKARDALTQQMHAELDTDRPDGYRQVLALEQEVDKTGASHDEARSLAAYAATILALEHHEHEMSRKARRLMAKLAQNSQEGKDSEESASLHRAAEALMVWGDGDKEQSRSEISRLDAQPRPSPYELLESLRLKATLVAASNELTPDAHALSAVLSTQSRGFMYLGLLALGRGDHAEAAQKFAQVRKLSPQHERARMGEMWLALGDLREHQDSAQLLGLTREVDALLDNEKLSSPERSMALMVRARAQHIGGEASLAARDAAEARQLDSNNPLLALEDVLPKK